MQEYISFPKNEYGDYIKRLNSNKTIYTTKVSSEVDKYKINAVYKSNFGNLKVVFLKHYLEVSSHPFYNELTNNQLCEINKYIEENGYDVIGLIKIKKNTLFKSIIENDVTKKQKFKRNFVTNGFLLFKAICQYTSVKGNFPLETL